MSDSVDMVVSAARRMLERGARPEEVDAFIERAAARLDANARDQQDAKKLSGKMKALSFVERMGDSASFGVAGLLGDALAANASPNGLSFKELREERNSRGEQLGGLGVLADVIGGLATGGASLSAIKGLQGVGTLRKVGLAAGDAALQGGVTGFATGLDEGTAEGVARALRRGAQGATIGTVAGGALGGVVTGGARVLGNRQLTKALADAGVDVSEAKVLSRQLAEATPDDLRRALDKVAEFEQAGKGGVVMAADVLGTEGQGLLRAVANLSPKARAVVESAIRGRDAGVVGRVRGDLGDAGGFTPQQMDQAEDALLAQQKAAGDAGFSLAREQGAAFDALPTQVRTAPPITTAPAQRPSLRDAIDDHRTRMGLAATRKEGTVMQQSAREMLERRSAEMEGLPIRGESRPLIDTSALPDDYAEVVEAVTRAGENPIVQRTWANLVKQNPEKFADLNPNDWANQHKVYTEINKAIRAIEKKGENSAANESYNALLEAKTLLNESLALRAPEFRPTNEAFADLAKGMQGYKMGQLAATRGRPSAVRRMMQKTPDGKADLFRKGFVDDLAEQAGAGPAVELGESARASRAIAQRPVRSTNAVDIARTVLGDDATNTLIQRAKLEGVMAKTSNEALGNSTTARQVNGIADVLGVIGDISSGFALNPAWWATMTGRRVTEKQVNRVSRMLADKNAQATAKALTKMGADDVRGVLNGLIELAEGKAKVAASAGATGRRASRVAARASGGSQRGS